MSPARTASSALKRLAASPTSSMALILGAAAACVAGYLVPRQAVYASRWFWGLGALSAAALAFTVQLQARALLGGANADRARRWGSLIFHTGLLLVIVAGLAQPLRQKRGFVQLMEGEIFLGREGEFLETEKGSLAGRLELPFGLRLDALRDAYWTDALHLRELASDLSILRGGRTEPVRVAVNSPLLDSGFAVYQSAYYGHAVSVELQRRDGQRLMTHFLLDRAALPGKPEVGGSSFADTDYLFSLRLRPDVSGKTFTLSNPSVEVEVFKGGRPVYAGPLTDKPILAPDGDRFTLAEIKPWSGLNIVDRSGLWLLRLGFIVTVLGASILFIRSPESDHVTV